MARYTVDKVLHLACDEKGKGYFEISIHEKPNKGFTETDAQHVTRKLVEKGLLKEPLKVGKKQRFYPTNKGKRVDLEMKIHYKKRLQEQRGGMDLAIKMLEAQLEQLKNAN